MWRVRYWRLMVPYSLINAVFSLMVLVWACSIGENRLLATGMVLFSLITLVGTFQTCDGERRLCSSERGRNWGLIPAVLEADVELDEEEENEDPPFVRLGPDIDLPSVLDDRLPPEEESCIHGWAP